MEKSHKIYELDAVLPWILLLTMFAVMVGWSWGQETGTLSTGVVKLHLYVRNLEMPVGSTLSVTFDATEDGIDVIEEELMPELPGEPPPFEDPAIVITGQIDRGTKMSKNIHVSFILDETGSMLSVTDQVISGYNEYVETLRQSKNAKKVRFTLTKFNSEKVEVVHSGRKLKDVPVLTRNTYHPEALTPLYDAIGGTVRDIEEHADDGDRVLVVIQTDGLENASQEYTRADIFSLITDKKVENSWEFVFLGADQDAWEAGAAIGVDISVGYNTIDTSSTLTSAGKSTVMWVEDGIYIVDSATDLDKEPNH